MSNIIKSYDPVSLEPAGDRITIPDTHTPISLASVDCKHYILAELSGNYIIRDVLNTTDYTLTAIPNITPVKICGQEDKIYIIYSNGQIYRIHLDDTPAIATLFSVSLLPFEMTSNDNIYIVCDRAYITRNTGIVEVYNISQDTAIKIQIDANFQLPENTDTNTDSISQQGSYTAPTDNYRRVRPDDLEYIENLPESIDSTTVISGFINSAVGDTALNNGTGQFERYKNPVDKFIQQQLTRFYGCGNLITNQRILWKNLNLNNGPVTGSTLCNIMTATITSNTSAGRFIEFIIINPITSMVEHWMYDDSVNEGDDLSTGTIVQVSSTSAPSFKSITGDNLNNLFLGSNQTVDYTQDSYILWENINRFQFWSMDFDTFTFTPQSEQNSFNLTFAYGLCYHNGTLYGIQILSQVVRLMTIDTNTWQGTLRGPLPFAGINWGMQLLSHNNRLYLVARNSQNYTAYLYEVNPTNGTATQLKQLISDSSGIANSRVPCAVLNGVGYMMSYEYLSNPHSNVHRGQRLRSFSLDDSGSSTIIGGERVNPTGLGFTYRSFNTMFARNGVLYCTASEAINSIALWIRLYSINSTTGAATKVNETIISNVHQQPEPGKPYSPTSMTSIPLQAENPLVSSQINKFNIGAQTGIVNSKPSFLVDCIEHEGYLLALDATQKLLYIYDLTTSSWLDQELPIPTDYSLKNISLTTNENRIQTVQTKQASSDAPQLFTQSFISLPEQQKRAIQDLSYTEYTLNLDSQHIPRSLREGDTRKTSNGELFATSDQYIAYITTDGNYKILDNLTSDVTPIDVDHSFVDFVHVGSSGIDFITLNDIGSLTFIYTTPNPANTVSLPLNIGKSYSGLAKSAIANRYYITVDSTIYQIELDVTALTTITHTVISTITNKKILPKLHLKGICDSTIESQADTSEESTPTRNNPPVPMDQAKRFSGIIPVKDLPTNISGSHIKLTISKDDAQYLDIGSVIVDASNPKS